MSARAAELRDDRWSETSRARRAFGSRAGGHSEAMQPEREIQPESDDDIDEARRTIDELEKSVSRPTGDDAAPDDSAPDDAAPDDAAPDHVAP